MPLRIWPRTRKNAEATPLAEHGSVANSVSVLLDHFGTRASSSGESVTTDSAMGVPTLRNGVNLIAGAIASLPR